MEKRLIEGTPISAVIPEAMTKHRIRERQAFKDLAEIKRRWQEAGQQIQEETKMALGMALKRREFLWYEAVSKGDYRTALEVEKDRCNLLGLYLLDLKEKVRLLEDRLYGTETTETCKIVA